jgi:hypothetical protein
MIVNDGNPLKQCTLIEEAVFRIEKADTNDHPQKRKYN